MAEDPAFNFQDTIIEGFICPSCHKSFGTPELLEHHFSKEHFHDALYSEPSNNFVKSAIPGKIRSHTTEFNKLRRVQVDRNNLESNLLLIRLDKLYNLPDSLDKAQRHLLEQNIVPWIDAKVDLCPRCGVRFGLGFPKDAFGEGDAPIHIVQSPSISRRLREGFRSASRFLNAIVEADPVYRRVHHCRLCGHIICGDCSFFLPKAEVARVLQTCNWTVGEDFLPLKSPSFLSSLADGVNKKNVGGGLWLMQRSSSNTSLDSAVSKVGQTLASWPPLRLCGVCADVLEQRLQRSAARNTPPPPLLDLFHRLKAEMTKVTEKMPLFSAMATSLNLGEEKYVLEMAKELRVELLQRLQRVEELGRAVAATGASEGSGDGSGGAEARVNAAVGRWARRFVQRHLPTLRLLPSADEHRRLAALRRAAAASASAPTLYQPPSSKERSAVVSSEDGWMPCATARSTDVDSGGGGGGAVAVLAEQRAAVAGFLAEARAAHRHPDEIRALAQNLADLDAELARLSAA